MVIAIIDEISGNTSFYPGVKAIRYGYAYNSIVFDDGKIMNFHNMIYSIYCIGEEESNDSRNHFKKYLH